VRGDSARRVVREHVDALRVVEVLKVAVDVDRLVVKRSDDQSQRSKRRAGADLEVIVVLLQIRLHHQMDAIVVGNREAFARKTGHGAGAHSLVTTGAVDDAAAGGEHVVNVADGTGDGEVVLAVLAGEEALLPKASHLRHQSRDFVVADPELAERLFHRPVGKVLRRRVQQARVTEGLTGLADNPGLAWLVVEQRRVEVKDDQSARSEDGGSREHAIEHGRIDLAALGGGKVARLVRLFVGVAAIVIGDGSLGHRRRAG
jgi:hypothetical protein